MAKSVKRARKAAPKTRRTTLARKKPAASAKSGDASLNQQLAEARAELTATAEILRVISSSPTDIQPVWDAILENALRLCDAQQGIVGQYDGKKYRTAAQRGANAEFAKWLVERGDIEPAATSALGQMIAERQVIHVPDLKANAGYRERAAVSIATVELGGVRTYLGVPMLKEGRVIGGIAIYRTEVRPFTQKQIDLMSIFASQAVIAIENVRLFNETREALEQQTAISEILRVISSSPVNVQPVLEAVAQRAALICDASDARIFLVEGDQFRPAAGFGDVAVEVAPRPLTRGSPSGRAIIDRAAQHIEDMLALPEEEFPVGRAQAKRSGWRTILSVPLMRENRALGTIALRRNEVRRFSEKQVALLETFADQAAIAIENVRLFNETKESLERQTATAEILRVISSSPTDIQPVWDAILENALRLCDAQQGIVGQYDGKKYRTVAQRGANAEFAKWLAERGDLEPAATTALGQMISERQVIHVPDLKENAGYRERAAVSVATVDLGGVRTYLGVPMLKEDRVIGGIAIYRTEVRPFTQKQTDLMGTFASQAVIAVENVRLFNETKALEEERLARLKSFFSPQLAELLAAGKGDELLKTHRREITVQFFDLRGFTAFTGAAEPEEVMELLSEFHGALGKLVMEQEGTIERFAGDSVMVFFNDPLPVERPAERAMQSALAMMRAFDPIAALWKKRGHDLGLGVGIAQGFATLGAIGFEGRRDYAAIGPVTNLAARLCAEAKSGQILADQKTVTALEGAIDFDALGELNLKGFSKPVSAFALRRA